MMKELTRYLTSNKIDHVIVDDDFVEISGAKYKLILPNDKGVLFSKEFELEVDKNYIECMKYVYNFGGRWYWEEHEDVTEPKMNELRYMGSSVSEIYTHSFLGVRGAYEILNGSRVYEDWCRKANFLGVSNLGICEKNTLAGVLKFQIECKKSGLKSVIGETCTVFRTKEDMRYELKLYVKNEIGWQNLLMINREINVTNDGFVTEEFLLGMLEGLYVIADPKSIEFGKLDSSVVDFFQLDTVEYENNMRDSQYLENLKKFVKSGIRPVSITDAFYLESEHSHVKRILNTISNVREHMSSNQYFKDKEDYFVELSMLFKEEDDRLYYFYQEAVNNEKLIGETCEFSVEVSKFHLPDYILTEEQKKRFKDKDELFWSLIQEGLSTKVDESMYDEYLDRVEIEYGVISQGEKLIDYFLILWDIIDWCNHNDILVGWGRGSSGGSIIAYLLGITNIDSIKYNLLFERFLNENRVKKSLPDIDSDFEGIRRDEIKAYMERRFGLDHVCSVGTYGNLKLKMLLNDISRVHNIPVQEVKAMTSIMDDMEKDGSNWTELFKLAAKSDRLKSFVKRHSNMVNDMRLCFMQPRSMSVHACATIITPDDKPIYNWFPVKKQKNAAGDDILVSEWEGIQLDSAGFLKEDILGLAQLDKFSDIIKRIHANKNVKIDFWGIPLEDKKVFKYFHNGWNEDTFQFGTKGLKKYTSNLKPDSIEELSAANALYRPGAMKSNAHIEFIDIKFGKKDVRYDYMLKEVTESTYGLYVYQEQAMSAAQKLAGFTLTEADVLRKVILTKGKKGEFSKKDEFQEKFVNGAMNNGCSEQEALDVWDKLEAFSGYGFNKSHAVAYSIMGYISQWFKVNYPLEFWETAIKFAKEIKYPDYINEINKTGDIKIVSVEINKSRDVTFADQETNSIYWSFKSIKQIAEAAAGQLMKDREENGIYFSFEEFYDRHKFKGSKVNKSVFENLIICGAFDTIENISSPSGRMELMVRYWNLAKVKEHWIDVNKAKHDWWWVLQQKKLSGIALFDYKPILDFYITDSSYNVPIEDFFWKHYAEQKKKVKLGGVIVDFIERTSQKGEWCKMTIESNYVFISVILWKEQYARLKDMNFQNHIGDLMVMSGEVVPDRYGEDNALQACGDTEIFILS